ncbi:MAG: hypothetical protein AAF826_10855, partial [Pseudomonadota bacterium]
RRPWLANHLEHDGYSVLGVQCDKKNWFRMTPAPELLDGLSNTGFFDFFERIVFIGSSMGGFAALSFAPLVPKADVIVWSPQTSLSKQICPFEDRYPYGFRISDWTTKPYLDAVASVPFSGKIFVLYDPFVLEDKLHADRIQGENVTHIRLPHFAHQSIRMVMKTGALSALIRSVVTTRSVGPEVFSQLRNRRQQRKWLRQMIADLEARDRSFLTLIASRKIGQMGSYAFAKRAMLKAQKRLKL